MANIFLIGCLYFAYYTRVSRVCRYSTASRNQWTQERVIQLVHRSQPIRGYYLVLFATILLTDRILYSFLFGVLAVCVSHEGRLNREQGFALTCFYMITEATNLGVCFLMCWDLIHWVCFACVNVLILGFLPLESIRPYRHEILNWCQKHGSFVGLILILVAIVLMLASAGKVDTGDQIVIFLICLILVIFGLYVLFRGCESWLILKNN